MSESTNTGRAGGAPAPSPQLQRLGALVGRWRSQGHIVGEVPVSITQSLPSAHCTLSPVAGRRNQPVQDPQFLQRLGSHMDGG